MPKYELNPFTNQVQVVSNNATGNTLPTSSNDRSIAVFNGTNGQSIRDSLIQITSDGAIQTIDGENRGNGAIDLQTTRSYPASVASGDFSAILSGNDNEIHSLYSLICGGYYNYVPTGISTIIVGGNSNICKKDYSFLGGGQYNLVDSSYSFLGGGDHNQVMAEYSAVVTGKSNTVKVESQFYNTGYSTIITGRSNIIENAVNSVILTGESQLIRKTYSNTQVTSCSAILTGTYNLIESNNSFILGGYANSINPSASFSTILGGSFAENFSWGQTSYGIGSFFSEEDLANDGLKRTSRSQSSIFYALGVTQDGSQKEIFLDGISLRMLVPPKATWSFLIRGIAKRVSQAFPYSSDTYDEKFCFQLDGIVDRSGLGNRILGNVDKTLKSSINLPWDFDVLTSSEYLILKATGEANKRIHWAVTIDVVELIG